MVWVGRMVLAMAFLRCGVFVAFEFVVLGLVLWILVSWVLGLFEWLVCGLVL